MFPPTLYCRLVSRRTVAASEMTPLFGSTLKNGDPGRTDSYTIWPCRSLSVADTVSTLLLVWVVSGMVWKYGELTKTGGNWFLLTVIVAVLLAHLWGNPLSHALSPNYMKNKNTEDTIQLHVHVFLLKTRAQVRVISLTCDYRVFTF